MLRQRFGGQLKGRSGAEGERSGKPAKRNGRSGYAARRCQTAQIFWPVRLPLA
jgi:hypothetical protein